MCLLQQNTCTYMKGKLSFFILPVKQLDKTTEHMIENIHEWKPKQSMKYYNL